MLERMYTLDQNYVDQALPNKKGKLFDALAYNLKQKSAVQTQ